MQENVEFDGWEWELGGHWTLSRYWRKRDDDNMTSDVINNDFSASRDTKANDIDKFVDNGDDILTCIWFSLYQLWYIVIISVYVLIIAC